MPAEDWQRALRRQFGRAQDFQWANLGSVRVFCDFEGVNPATHGRYRVAIRGAEPGSSTCTCADHATNQLGTCKHIEFMLGQLLKRRGAKAALQRGWQPAHSALWLHQGPQPLGRGLAAGTVLLGDDHRCPDEVLANYAARTPAGVTSSLSPNQKASTSSRPRPALATSRMREALRSAIT